MIIHNNKLKLIALNFAPNFAYLIHTKLGNEVVRAIGNRTTNVIENSNNRYPDKRRERSCRDTAPSDL